MGLGKKSNAGLAMQVNSIWSTAASPSSGAEDVSSKGVMMTRPLCPYPQIAQRKGYGNSSEAANFGSVAPSEVKAKASK